MWFARFATANLIKKVLLLCSKGALRRLLPRGPDKFNPTLPFTKDLLSIMVMAKWKGPEACIASSPKEFEIVRRPVYPMSVQEALE